MAKVVIPSVIRWTGSKRNHAHKIVPHFPSFSGRYFEPFMGSAAVLYMQDNRRAVAGDVYEPLVDFWKLLQANPHKVISDYTSLWQDFQNGGPDVYYDIRKRFNESRDPSLLQFLTRTCAVGMVRFNANGDFNNSLHLSRKGMTPANFSSAVFKWYEKIGRTDFRCGDFYDTTKDAKEGDFVYMDPPYIGSSNRYIKDIDLPYFVDVISNLTSRGVLWAISLDGKRGSTEYEGVLPAGTYKRKIDIESGKSPMGLVLNGKNEKVTESLYINY